MNFLLSPISSCKVDFFFYLFIFAYALGYLMGLIISEKHGIVITGLFFIILSLPD